TAGSVANEVAIELSHKQSMATCCFVVVKPGFPTSFFPETFDSRTSRQHIHTTVGAQAMPRPVDF
ncbi:MAG: hypothetical protein AAF787_24485, partial [Chloroflexota bacterium]